MTSPDQVLRAIQAIEAQLSIIKEQLSETGVKEEGLVGIFDGEFMTLEDGRRFVIPPNYASKSMLVPGDTLRMVEDPNGGEQHRFKQIGKVDRSKSTGLLTRKDGKFEVICEEGSFKVLAAAIKHFDGQPGDQATIQFAKIHTKGSWAAVEKVIKSTDQATLSTPVVGQTVPAQPTVSSGPAVIAHAPQATTPTVENQPQVIPEPKAIPTVDSAPTSIATPVAVSHNPAVKPQASKSSDQRPASKTTSNSSSSRNKPRNTNSQPTKNPVTIAPKPVAPIPASRPQPVVSKINPDLSPSQGEIAIPTIMDEDDLA